MMNYQTIERAESGQYTLVTPISAARFMMPYWNPHRPDGSLASIREDARTIFKDRPLTDDCLFANSIWPEPELLGLVDDLTGRTGRNL